MKVVRPLLEQPDVGFEAILQPAANVVTRHSTASQYFVMTTASAEVSCPARLAWLLLVDVPFGEPENLAVWLDSVAQASHSAMLVADEAVTRADRAVGRHAEVACGRTAGIGLVRAAVELTQRRGHVCEWEAAADSNLTLEFTAAHDHLCQHRREIAGFHFSDAGWRAEDRRESNAVKTQTDELHQGLEQLEIPRSDRDPG